MPNDPTAKIFDRFFKASGFTGTYYWPAPKQQPTESMVDRGPVTTERQKQGQDDGQNES